jgi:superfamily II DNA helicase RecQ
MGLFNILRDWRSQRCKKDGVPPYIVFTNLQLAMIVKKRPQSTSELTQIEGIGKGKAQKYGEEVLSISKVNLEVKSKIKEIKPDGA